MASDDPGPGQKYTIMARKQIAALRAKELGVCTEIRWCPSHKGIEGNGIADEWAKQAADEPAPTEWRLQGPTRHRQEEAFPSPEVPR